MLTPVPARSTDFRLGVPAGEAPDALRLYDRLVVAHDGPLDERHAGGELHDPWGQLSELPQGKWSDKLMTEGDRRRLFGSARKTRMHAEGPVDKGHDHPTVNNAVAVGVDVACDEAVVFAGLIGKPPEAADMSNEAVCWIEDPAVARKKIFHVGRLRADATALQSSQLGIPL